MYLIYKIYSRARIKNIIMNVVNSWADPFRAGTREMGKRGLV